jgi:hypothetical protein
MRDISIAETMGQVAAFEKLPEKSKEFKIGYYRTGPDGKPKLTSLMKANHPFPISEWAREPGLFSSEDGITRSGVMIRERDRYFDPSIRND